jgi:hypothetical protein
MFRSDIPDVLSPSRPARGQISNPHAEHKPASSKNLEILPIICDSGRQHDREVSFYSTLTDPTPTFPISPMPKRSAGCFECRKRKVGCDGTKPECKMCVKRGTKCPGYRPTQSFILHEFKEQAEKPSLIKEDDNRYRYANQQSPEVFESSPSDAESGGMVRLQSHDARSLDEYIPRRVSPIAIERVLCLETFLSLYLPQVEGQTLPPPAALILSLPSIPATSEALLAALDALSAAQLAVSNRNFPLINRSRSLYGTALSRMVVTIQSPARALEDETLLATYILSLYEVSRPRNRRTVIYDVLISSPGICRYHKWTWLLLPLSRSSTVAQTARPILFQNAVQPTDISRNTVQFGMSSPSPHRARPLIRKTS